MVLLTVSLSLSHFVTAAHDQLDYITSRVPEFMDKMFIFYVELKVDLPTGIARG